ncbi:4Fe-4S dicluster domain-containing protein [Alicyclobacillus sp. SO9]|uniref:4Fe-4S dicluster domain-containing protein n=1 Tax=Alicyclobacillus sp. SO9 TaxID=2665646 RepID=UPI0018E7974D|nr:4Fe-4S dicluster domain-containing protein [Alicyclobacillus sp. SO9]QQE77218.1 polysulfide reductase NrfD [Alicyclobacillus sp. SO9]
MVELDVVNSAATTDNEAPIRWGKVINQETCIGCHACSIACKMEHDVPLSVNRTYVKQVEVGTYPEVSRQFQITRCNQCDDAPCVPICPVTAMFKRDDGIVDFDRDVCIGCKACIAACPYDAIYINPDVGSAEKCNFCAHRIDQGLEPACVIVCPVEAIVVGNLNDPDSEVLQLISRNKAEVRKPEKGTNPKVFYVDASDYTLNPTRSEYTGMHYSAEEKEGYPVHSTKAAQPKHTVAAARLAYDVPHNSPWHWEVSTYTWTKSISSGVFIMFAILAFSGQALSPMWELASSVIGGFFLAVTGVLLIADLQHPMRFIRIFTRPQWKSWLVKGSFIIMAYSLVLLVQFILGIAGITSANIGVSIFGIVLGALTAMYTAFLLSQAKGRDLWQNPALPIHFVSQAALAGSAAYSILALFIPLSAAGVTIVHATLLASVVVHLGFVLSELMIPHTTEHARRAAKQMLAGKYKGFYWTGFIVGAALPTLFGIFVTSMALPAVAAILALVGLLAYEHAYVQAGQSVPLS